MARPTPVFLAFLLNLCGYYVFLLPQPPQGANPPLMSSIFFAFGVFLLILDTRLYPASFRILHWIPSCLYQFLVASFILETTLNDFWFPFEIHAITFLPIFGDILGEIFVNLGLTSLTCFCDIFHKSDVILFWSYILSGLFLCSVLHATRIVDFRILMRCGAGLFVKDVGRNLKHIKNRVMRKMRKQSVSRRSRTCNRTGSSTGCIPPESY